MNKKPNLIYILADDMGYGDVSAFNEDAGFKTPNLDKMCEEGMSFCDAHTTSSLCTPSRYGILTGRYNWRSELKSDVLCGFSNALIEEGRVTIAEMLRQSGYNTAAIGKWHLGMNFAKTENYTEENRKAYLMDASDREFFYAPDGIDYKGEIKNSPITKGFDYFFGISGSLDMPPYVYIENDHFTEEPDHETFSFGDGRIKTGNAFWRKGPTGPSFVHEEVLPTFTNKVLDKIDEYKNDDKPFFIYFPLNAPHAPLLPTKEFRGKSGINDYADYVLMVDDVVGKVTNKLKEAGIFENTIVVFTADNGCSWVADIPELLEHGHNPSYIFRGLKADIFEGGHRVPFIVTYPELIKAGTKSDALISLSDMMATMADIVGYNIEDDMAEDSVSNLPLWKEETEQVREDIVHQSGDGSLALRRGNFKLEMCAGAGGFFTFPFEEKDLVGLPEIQLYKLDDDISEKKNVYEEYPEVVEDMKKVLKEYVFNGRSTPGKPQKNNGEQIWEKAKWLAE